MILGENFFNFLIICSQLLDIPKITNIKLNYRLIIIFNKKKMCNNSKLPIQQNGKIVERNANINLS